MQEKESLLQSTLTSPEVKLIDAVARPAETAGADAAGASVVTPAIRPSESLYGWIFLIGLAAIVGVIDPVIIDLHARLEVSLGLLAAGAALIALRGAWQRPWMRWAGAGLLWLDVGWGIGSQISPLNLAPGYIWGPRGLVLLVALVGWLLFLGLGPWLRYGLLAVAVPSLAVLGLLWLTAPVAARNAALYWPAVDSYGTVYANDVDNGLVWVFDGGGGVRGNLWPRRGKPGQPSPGFQPADMGAELAAAGVVPTPVPGAPSEREFLFCGLAVDPHDQLYTVDPELFEVRRFDHDGQLQASWRLPESFVPARGCLAADDTRVYIGDNHGLIYVFDPTGKLLTKWNQEQLPLGLSIDRAGLLWVLRQTGVAALSFPDGKTVKELRLPAPTGDLQIPYQAILARANGEILVTDVATNQVRRFSADGQPLGVIGSYGGWPGQFGGLGGLAEDRAGRLYVTDFQYHVIQRFNPDGQVSAVWSAPENQAGGE